MTYGSYMYMNAVQKQDMGFIQLVTQKLPRRKSEKSIYSIEPEFMTIFVT